jgi:hypothetical protein
MADDEVAFQCSGRSLLRETFQKKWSTTGAYRARGPRPNTSRSLQFKKKGTERL